MPLLQLRDAHLAFGPVPVLDAVDLAIDAKERVCLIGRNGTGKSTLLKVIAGTQALEGGTIQRAEGLRIGVLEQTVPRGGDATVHAIVAEGLGDHGALLERFHRASLAAGSGDAAALDELGRLQEAIEAAGAWDGNRRVDVVLDRLGLPADARLADCSGGMRRRAMLARALVAEPDLLILDEPTNHLDIEAVTELEAAVRAFPGAVLFVTHDRAFIGAVATRLVELDRGTLRSYPGDYAAYQRRKAEELAAEAEAAKQADRFLAQEEAWIRQGIKARRTRDEGRVRRLEALRKARAERRERKGDVALAAGDVERSGKLVIEVEDLAFAHDERTIVDGFSTRILRGDRVGLIGRNGSGKTTLLRLLLGRLPPDRGTVRLGTQLQIAYFDQERMQLDVEATLRDNVVEGSDFVELGGRRKHVVGYLGDFLFSPRQVQAPVKTLSGGERNRLLLAKLFAKPANLLVLDEPTNDLDVETLELLEELLAEWPGTLLLVSHDRTFLDRVVTSTLVLDGEGGVAEYVGGYSDWVRQWPAPGTALPSAPGDAGAPGSVARAAGEEGAAAQAPASPGPERPAGAANGGGAKAPAARRKLGYKEQRELDALPERIEALEAAHEAAVARTLTPDFYKGDRDAIAAVLEQVKALEAELEAAYARWEALEGG